jgi:hypothetical protein
MLHPKVRRAVAGGAVAALAVTVPLASPSTAYGSDGAESGQAPTDAPTSSTESELEDVAPAVLGHRVRLRVKRQDVRPVRTTRTWARRLLDDQGVSYDGNDLVRVRRDGKLMKGSQKRRLREGDAVQLVAVDRKKRVRRTMIERPTRTRTVSHLRPGQRKVKAKGRPGLRKITVVKTRQNGNVVDVDRTKRVMRTPRPRKVLVGAQARSVPGTGRLNWRALANCESSGNPRAVNPAGYYGLYQFNTGTWRSVGGSGLPSNASASEQTYRAKLLYKQRGRSPWPHCGRLL